MTDLNNVLMRVGRELYLQGQIDVLKVQLSKSQNDNLSLQDKNRILSENNIELKEQTTDEPLLIFPKTAVDYEREISDLKAQLKVANATIAQLKSAKPKATRQQKEEEKIYWEGQVQTDDGQWRWDSEEYAEKYADVMIKDRKEYMKLMINWEKPFEERYEKTTGKRNLFMKPPKEGLNDELKDQLQRLDTDDPVLEPVEYVETPALVKTNVDLDAMFDSDTDDEVEHNTVSKAVKRCINLGREKGETQNTHTHHRKPGRIINQNTDRTKNAKDLRCEVLVPKIAGGWKNGSEGCGRTFCAIRGGRRICKLHEKTANDHLRKYENWKEEYGTHNGWVGEEPCHRIKNKDKHAERKDWVKPTRGKK